MRTRFPSCTARRCDAHHVQHWIDGGATSLDIVPPAHGARFNVADAIAVLCKRRFSPYAPPTGPR